MTGRKRSAAELEEPDFQASNRATRSRTTAESGSAVEPEVEAESGDEGEDGQVEAQPEAGEADDDNGSEGGYDEVNEQDSGDDEDYDNEPEYDDEDNCEDGIGDPSQYPDPDPTEGQMAHLLCNTALAALERERSTSLTESEVDAKIAEMEEG
ncbi:hypothetical protein C8F04DRAFT_1394895 [Mycena alexandri]|uniref:Uncharacterized protein n=1 Tax=Mycena alexandri TaxID=1745969 RepID=A0AAD6SWW9_9AGAR|nr:hypothetical protein C8F04DRAFT_1394895 [Mycena alexandri]